MLTFDDWLAGKMKDPEFKAEWDALEPEFQAIREYCDVPPGETISDFLKDREMTLAELVTRTGFPSTYINKVISGKKDISPDFAAALERAFDVPKSFWLNLQANYNSELLEVKQNNKETTGSFNLLEYLSRCFVILKHKAGAFLS